VPVTQNPLPASIVEDITGAVRRAFPAPEQAGEPH
jgi:hypothetical protein